ncbi:MAG TPA: amino acid adenylation domain-containing protein, partial [Thermoanaerobaculia bacterium]|nr:amino acid adenylation domain-containing protein [Thermoanaerobaculia bacterium]
MESPINKASDIAIVGMAGRFPGAPDVERFWANLVAGVESITFFSKAELRAAGVEPERLADPAFVGARGVLDGAELFDAALFGFNPREAEVIDPQHRLLLECAWEALERAGYAPHRFAGPIGVFAGAGINTYLLSNLQHNAEVMGAVGSFQAMLGSGADFLATRISYKLGLRGPSLTVQTACSTSLVAVHLAVQSLLNGECDLALAGGVRLLVPRQGGQIYQAGSLFSPDGHCRPFDAAAAGTLDGEGVGLVVLKRLAEAIDDGDTIHAVILGTAINNDGAAKLGYTVPSVEGQAEVVAMAQALAGIDPGTLGMIEAHGTGTPLGDPIEVAALSRAFAMAATPGRCALGSLKSNLGHLDAAAGIASLIKATLAVERGVIPPSLHFERPNPQIDFAASPFYVPVAATPWPDEGPRRAGVSSFGIGGTNAHVVIEAAPEPAPGGPSRPLQLVVLSARSGAALEESTRNLAEHLGRHPAPADLDLADVAYTLALGRTELDQRRIAVCAGTADAASVLAALDPKRVLTRAREAGERPVFFLFPGQGAQHPGMAAELYATEPVFRAEVDCGAEILRPRLGLDLRQVLAPTNGGDPQAAAERLAQTALAQPALFVVEHALARLWMAWGIRPQAMLGHSVGEYVAACLAGVFSFEDALRLVAERGRLMQEMPAGSMLAVPLAEAAVRPLLGGLSLAAVNGPAMCVVSGEADEVEALAVRLTEEGKEVRRLHTSHAFHSAAMEPMLESFSAAFAGLRLGAPEIPFVSNLTGRWIRPAEATSPHYWVRHLRETVRFSAGLEALFARPGAVFLEVGPGQALTTLVRQHPKRPSVPSVLASLPKPGDGRPADAALLRTLGQLWLSGVEVDWAGFYAQERRRRVPLPTYPFERQRYWVEPTAGTERGRRRTLGTGTAEGKVAGWFWGPLWHQVYPPATSLLPAEAEEGSWLIFADAAETGLGAALAARLRERGREVAVAHAGERFLETAGGDFVLRPGEPEDYIVLLERLARRGLAPGRIVHLWSAGPARSMGEEQERGFYSLFHLARALGDRRPAGARPPLHLGIVSTGVQRITGGEELIPARATLLGPAAVLPQEYPGISCAAIDVTLLPLESRQGRGLLDRLLAELAVPAEPVVAYRGTVRWRQVFAPLPLPEPRGALPLRAGGTYLITGGLGGVGLELAGFLAREAKAKLVLAGRSPFPERETWPALARGTGRTARLARRLQELEAAGGEVWTVAADVTDAAAMRRMGDEVRRRFGRVDGAIHAAGVPGGGLMQFRTREEVAAVLAPKVAGTLLLAELLAADPPDFLVLCSSLNALVGGPGQFDYAAANAFLDAFAQSSQGALPVVSINWDAWRGVGMAALRHAVDEKEEEPGEQEMDAEVLDLEPFAHPLLRQRGIGGDGAGIFVAHLTPGETWVLDEHRLGGHPVVPGTAYLEMAGAAYRGLTGTVGAIELRDVQFVTPLQVVDGESRELQVVLRAGNGNGDHHFTARSRNGGGWQDHVTGQVGPIPEMPEMPGTPAALDVSSFAGWEEEVLGEEHREDLKQAGLGPRWELLKKVYRKDGDWVGLLELAPELAGDVADFALHPAILDAATSFAEYYVAGTAGHYYLPLSYKRLRLLGPLPSRIYSHARLHTQGLQGVETLSFDLSMLDETGVERVRVEEFTLKRVDVAATLRGHSRKALAATTRAVSAPASPLEASLASMAPEKAIEAFGWILSGAASGSPLPQVAVSVQPLPEVLARARSVTAEVLAESLRPAAGGHARPDLETPYVAPEGELEERLAAIWSHVLGLDRVGAADDFFALGGHSLLGTQLMSRVREAFGVEVPLGRLFEAATVADLAAVVEGLRQQQGLTPFGRTRQEIPRRSEDGPAPLSFAQQRLWFLEELQPGLVTYNLPLGVRLTGRLHAAALEAALAEILTRHEALRTVFPRNREVAGEPVQVVLPVGEFFLPQIDLAGLAPEAGEREARRVYVEHDVRLPFDLGRGPLFRPRLLRLGARDHILLTTTHHIVSDGWSHGVLMRELVSLYPAFRAGRSSPLPALPIQYADYAVWQRRRLSGAVLEAELAYWRRLEGAPAIIELPADHLRPAVQSFAGASLPFRIDRRRTGEILGLGRQQGATLFMTLLAAWAVWLGRATRQDDLVIGTPIAGRDRLETEGLIGFFVNSLALRLDLSGEPTFAELLGRVRQVALDAYAHAELPFERLVESLRPERYLSHNPLFQVMFALQNVPLSRMDLAGLSLAPLELPDPTAQFDLGLTLTEVEGGLDGAFRWSVDLFDASTVHRMIGQLRTVLAGAVADPGQRLSALPLLTPPERQQLYEWNDRRSAETPADPLALFAAQVARAPQAVALVDGAVSVAYADLGRRADRLARRLRAAGVGPGVAVGLCLERSAELIVGLLGIWKAGGAYVPLDPDHPRSRLAFLLEDSAVPFVLTRERLVERLPPSAARVLSIDAIDAEAESVEEDAARWPPARPGDLAYRIYTSGTTGQPKAVEVERGSLAAILAATREAFGFAPGDRMPCVAPFSFDIFLFELLSPLLAGGTSLLVSHTPTLDVERLAAGLGEATLLHAVPALMRQVVEAVRRGPGSGRGESLRMIFVGGDTVPAELLSDLRETFPEARLCVLYGPTEGTILASAHPVPPLGEGGPGAARPLLGRPLAGVVLEVNDPAGEPVPVGVPGEIWIGGAGVTRGYWRREALNAEKYVLREGERFFRTGDLARRLPDGSLEFLGRIDQQVKVRGFRIEPGEIASVLARHPAVREAVVEARAEAGAGARGRRLVAYVVRRPDAETEAGPEPAAGAEHVDQWRALYEETYGRAAAADPTLNLEGWNSSYTGEPIPAEAMREWVDRTVERVLALGGRRVLEIGCGTGLLLFRIAPHVERYHGTDFSPVALAGIRRHLARPGAALPQVSLAEARADDGQGIAPGDFDLILLNSVAQYFPGIDYLTRVLEGAVRTLADGATGSGTVFVGDLRSLSLLTAFHTSVALHQASPDLPVAELRRRVADEEELTIDPGYFFALARHLPAIRRIEVLQKRGRWHNELTRFRYDVVLHVGGDPGEPDDALGTAEWLDWREERLALPEIARRLAEERPKSLALAGIPNARLSNESAALALLAAPGQELETVAELRQALAEHAERTERAAPGEAGVDPEELWELADRLGYTAVPLWDGISAASDRPEELRFAALLMRHGSSAPAIRPPEVPADLPLAAFANDPLRGQRARRLVPELHRFLKSELPEYMVPSHLVLLDALPLTAHGKVDRAALPEPDPDRAGVEAELVAPRGPLEEAVARIWLELLGLEAVGVLDNFFALGGHSLLATQVVSRLRDSQGVELPVRALFEEPTIAGLAARVEAELRTRTAVALPPLRPAGREVDPPLSFAQQRLWFLAQLTPESAAYNIPTALGLEGPLDRGALAASFDALLARHEVLRTTFGLPIAPGGALPGEPVQRIAPPRPWPLPDVDLAALPAARREAETRRLGDEDALRPFVLERGPLVRALLLRRGTDDHVALLTMHHIVSDGWSVGVLVSELAALYPAFAAGRRSPLPPLPPLIVQYADFALWQRRWLQGEALERQLGYWRERLAGAPPWLPLPVDRPRSAARERRAGLCHFVLPGGLGAALQALGQAHGATLFMILLAAWQALLSRTTGEDDVVVGTPVANRTHRETEGLIGFFVNMLVLRTAVDETAGLVDLVGQVRESTLAAYAHQDLPFERLVQALVPERDPAHTPLFQVAFALQNAPAAALDLPGLRLVPVETRAATAKFDWTLSLAQVADGIAGQLEYDRGLFDRSTLERLLARFERLLEGAVAAPERPVADLPLLSAAELHQLRSEWNPIPAVAPLRAVHEILAAQAAATPDAVAAVFGERSLTYQEICRRADEIAFQLLDLGVTPGTLVGLCLEPSLDFVIGQLGILKAGAAYVPLDPAYPPERLALMVEEARLSWILTDERHAGSLPPTAAQTVVPDPRRPAGSSRPPLPRDLDPESLAYVIFTSGSTGRPKGVGVPHRAICRLVLDTDYVRLGRFDRVAQVSNLSFDAATFEIWGALLNGGCLVGVEKRVALSAPDFAAWLAEREIGTMFLTTALFQQHALAVPTLFRRLDSLLFGGEAVEPRGVRQLLASGAPRRLLHVYGPTETTTFASWQTVESVAADASTLPIGRPLRGARLRLLDGALRPVPIGVVGELFVGGSGLAQGYVHRPELTAERFVPDPLGGERGGHGEHGERLYRTGDRARLLPDGAVEFLGRADLQVKLRGFRVEPGEVEAALAALPGVREAAVVVQGQGESRRLVAFVAGNALAANTETGSLRQALEAKLPAYMVPAVFVELDALPLTPNGKVDRRALAARPVVAAGTAGSAPRTPAEELMAGLWAELLGRQAVGVDEDFFALGGHSLLATQLASRLRSVFGVELPLAAVFETPTVAGLAAEVEVRLAAREVPAAPPIRPMPQMLEPPLSFAQQRLWFIHQLDPESPAYNVPAAIELTGRLDRAALAAALGEVVARHEVLRTTFPAVEGRPVARVAAPGGFSLPLIDLQGLPEEERAEAVRRLGAEEAERPFDLARGPLLRAALLRPSAEEHVLLLDLHHIAFDGWSVGVLVRELAALYAAHAASTEGSPSPLPPLVVQYADFAAWQRDWLRGAVLDAQLGYWRERLAGAPAALALPTDRPRPAVRSGRGAVQPVRLPATLAGALAALARREAATLFMVLLAGWDALLFRLTGQTDLVVGSPVANRNHREIEELIGFFVNSLPLRVRLSPQDGFRALSGRVREAALGAYAHQDLPFERLVEELAPERNLQVTPLFQVSFGLQNTPRQALSLPGLRLTLLETPSSTAKFDWTLALAEEGEEIAGALEYGRDLFDPTTIRRLLGDFERLLAGAVAEPDRPVEELPLLSPAELHQLLLDWNETGVGPEPGSLVHGSFESWAERTPDTAAVVVAGIASEVLTYAGLDRRANQLARRLRSLGVAPDSMVGLCVERSPSMIVALLGILKAGAAYVPLDPDYPRERLAFLVEDARLPVLVTEERLLGALPEMSATILCLDADGPAIAQESDGRFASGASPESLAYLIYTSGSTGTPKGVMVPHRGWSNLAAAERRLFALPPGSRVLQFASASFDASAWEIAMAWGAGGTLVLGSRERRLAAEELTALLRECDIATLPPTTLAILEPEELASPATLVVAGEACPLDLARRWSAGRRFWNAYGPTETSVCATAKFYDGGDRLTIGRPIDRFQVYVLDASGRPAPVGVTGELYLGGSGLARGYLHLPERTAERFVAHSFAALPGARLYRTGDLARLLPDGEIELLGRADQQVKVRGFRIELGEVEAALSAHPGVREAAVVAQGEGADRRLVAFVVSDIEAGELRRFLAARLPGYLVPAAVAVLERLPLTANGKVDRPRLAAEDVLAEAGTLGAAPRTPIEEMLAGQWAELLGRETVGVEDDFFALGGHSLLATQLASRIRSAFGVELPLASVFKTPTVAGLAAEIEVLLAARQGPEAPPIRPVPRTGEPTLSFAQQRLWFVEQLEPGGSAYNIPVAVRSRRPLDAGALAWAIDRVIERHEALRTRFREVDGRAIQRIESAVTVGLPAVDLSGLAAERRLDLARRLAREEAARPFDLGRCPLLRTLLVDLGDTGDAGDTEDTGGQVLLLTLHHIVGDGWSMGLLLREVEELYFARTEGRPPLLPELPIQYADFAAWQRHWLTGPRLTDHLAYIRRRFSGELPRLELPADGPPSTAADIDPRGGAMERRLTPALSLALRALGRRQGGTLAMTLLAGFALLLSRLSG